MSAQNFGGDWTDRKLECLRKYLQAYRTIFTKNPKASFFRTWYVDAFAGTGSRSSKFETVPQLEVYQDEDAKFYRDGSTKIALGLENPFDNYLFIEKSKVHARQLQNMVQNEYATLFDQCDFRIGDANIKLKRWCSERNWKKERAVIFFDPYGMQVEWATIEILASTGGVDLWYLFPLGMGVLRLLKKSGDIPVAWEEKLDIVFGTDSWRSRFYQTEKQVDLFGDRESIRRTVDQKHLDEFVHERLKSCFGKNVAKGLILTNSKSSPLYLLCFAASNERGAAPALRIAKSILND